MWWVVSTFLFLLLRQGWAACYFPFEHHGLYAVQSAYNRYSEVLVEIDRILPYGACHRRIGPNLILRDMSNGCLRCFRLEVRSLSVLQLHTRDPQSSCATSVNDTLRLCPTAEQMNSPRNMRRNRIHELMMYKTQTRSMEPHSAPVYCPISGHFSFSYDAEAPLSCAGTQSHLSNCPHGYGLQVQFRGCAHDARAAGRGAKQLTPAAQPLNRTFQCLADWKDAQQRRYMALLDVTASGTGRPRYRCAMYEEVAGSGRILVAFSADSSCTRRLESASSGHERLVLYAAASRPWPAAVRRAACTFPEWAQGHWQHSHVHANTVVYKDVTNFMTYTARCIGGHGEKFVIYTRSHCGDEAYNCIWFKKRGVNVMEFQLGQAPSASISNSLCQPQWFLDNAWITQGRERITAEASCPVSGRYVGVVPDTTGQLCAQLTSQCSAPQNMKYTVTGCANISQVYEEREYRCLGTWTEAGLMYTYTQRLDVLSYECFVGRILPDGSVQIEEAGIDDRCRRRLDPARDGMVMTQRTPCAEESSKSLLSHSPDHNTAPFHPPSPHEDAERRWRRPSAGDGGATTAPGRHAGAAPSDDRRRPPTAGQGAGGGGRETSRDRERSTQRTTHRWRPITARPGRRSGGSSGCHQMSALSPTSLIAVLLLLLLR